MPRFAISLMIVGSLLLSGAFSAFAQTPAPSPKSPGEIAAASRRLAEKKENCRLQAKAQKLSYLKRRVFARECVKTSP